MNNVFKYNIDPGELVLNYNAVNRALGYESESPPEYLTELVYLMINELNSLLNIQGGYRVIENGLKIFDKNRIEIEKCEFTTERIITNQLKLAQGLIIFVCTLGKEFDSWRKDFELQEDVLKIYIADILGSEIVEAAADWLQSKIEKQIRTVEIGTTNRFSPGYCDWNVSEQHRLFSFFPEKFCGVELNQSALMIPIKSISGIIGMGKGVKKTDYNCRICTMENCYLRIREN